MCVLALAQVRSAPIGTLAAHMLMPCPVAVPQNQQAANPSFSLHAAVLATTAHMLRHHHRCPPSRCRPIEHESFRGQAMHPRNTAHGTSNQTTTPWHLARFPVMACRGSNCGVGAKGLVELGKAQDRFVDHGVRLSCLVMVFLRVCACVQPTYIHTHVHTYLHTQPPGETST